MDAGFDYERGVFARDEDPAILTEACRLSAANLAASLEARATQRQSHELRVDQGLDGARVVALAEQSLQFSAY